MAVMVWRPLIYLALLWPGLARTAEDPSLRWLAVQQVGEMVGEVMVEQHLTSCHLVLLTSTPHSPVVSAILRRMRAAVMMAEVSEDQHRLPQGVWGDTRTTCRTLVLHLDTNTRTTNTTLSMVERVGLWMLPQTRVVVVGGTAGVEAVLLHPSLRNTIHALYLALHPRTPDTPPFWPRLTNHLTEWEGEVRVRVFRRCLYCRSGEAAVQLVLAANLASRHLTQQLNILNVLPHDEDQFANFHGHKFKVVTVSYFPYVDYVKNEDQPGASVTLKDSIDKRLFQALTDTLNFTYEMHENPERSWGLESGGQFNGMVGQLQREEVDLCTLISMTPQRLQNMLHARAYASDMLALTTLKPALLPEYLSIARLFSSEVWMSLLAGVVVFGLSLWVVQLAWVLAVEGRGVQLNTALLYGWGSLLEQSYPEPSRNTTGRVLVGWWLVFCLVITSAFRSSLIANLTVQGRAEPLDTFEDMVGRPGWQWGVETWTLKGVPYEYLSRHHSPVVQQVFRNMDVLTLEEAMPKVLKGGYSFLTFRNHIAVQVASFFTDRQGDTPLYISSKGVYNMPNYGWGFRRGAPFYARFYQLLMRLGESGIVSHWAEEVTAKRVKANRDAATFKSRLINKKVFQDNREVVLGLHHLQGAFYLLLLGSGLALLTLLGENLAHSHFRKQELSLQPPPGGV